MISVRTKICTENCKKAVKSSVSDFAAYVSEILGHFHLCLTFPNDRIISFLPSYYSLFAGPFGFAAGRCLAVDLFITEK